MHPYDELRPPSATPPDEICSCPSAHPVKLMPALGFNPVHCVYCNFEVPPERLQIPEALAEALAVWCSMYVAIETLWLDSGEYEAWAAHELFRIDSLVNRRGIELAKELNDLVPTYFALGDDQSRGEYVPRASCPLCGNALVRVDSPHDWRACHDCRLISPGE